MNRESRQCSLLFIFFEVMPKIIIIPRRTYGGYTIHLANGGGVGRKATCRMKYSYSVETSFLSGHSSISFGLEMESESESGVTVDR